MTDPASREGLSDADLRALDDLRAVQERIGKQMEDEQLPPHVRGRLLTEYRQYTIAILELELKRTVSSKPTKADELRERRRLRQAATREQHGLPPLAEGDTK